ncbi:MAG TPA: hypothetical protein VFN25_05715 [Dokdonella sp.]|uniref:hypothetical protein n=1 Tax=Dokdonella sp. TaxID=2291710 RepID=UPI002D7ED8F9|nr:hypothetical protein [Dokdonella sp.]HET9032386.1 hypothetical protein [Dokdonella sp.]
METRNAFRHKSVGAASGAMLLLFRIPSFNCRMAGHPETRTKGIAALDLLSTRLILFRDIVSVP